MAYEADVSERAGRCMKLKYRTSLQKNGTEKY